MSRVFPKATLPLLAIDTVARGGKDVASMFLLGCVTSSAPKSSLLSSGDQSGHDDARFTGSPGVTMLSELIMSAAMWEETNDGVESDAGASQSPDMQPW